MARLPGVPARDRREESDPGVVGTAQAGEPQTGVFRLRAQVQRRLRLPGTGCA